ncbi:MAG: dihydrodipicolinate synthase family protein [Gammaproteobacteria bacterium]
MPELFSPIVALLTPFDAEGRIDWRAFESYLAGLSEWGVRAVIANGTTGEFPSLTLDERQAVVEFVRAHFTGAVINNASSTCIDDARRLAAGAGGHGDAVLLLPPYYFAKASNDGLCRFIARALEGAALPVFLYHFPKHTGNAIDCDLIARLIEQGVGIKGIKDSGGQLDNALSYRSRFPDLKVLYANDSEALAALQGGLQGLVTGGANPLPEFPIAIQRCALTDFDAAERLQRGFDGWNRFRAGSPLFEIPLLKAAMGARIPGFPIHVRPPLTPAPKTLLSRIRSAVLASLAEYERLSDES